MKKANWNRSWNGTCKALGALALVSAGAAAAAEGEFVIPEIRAGGGTLFSYWDRFTLPIGTTYSYLYPHVPEVPGPGDADGNPSNFGDTALLQVDSPTAFLTGSGAIYDFQGSVGFEVHVDEPGDDPVTNVIFQVQTGGRRFELDDIRLRYTGEGGEAVDLVADYKALDDPGAGGFTDRLMSGFQWDLTGLDVREFTIVFRSAGSSMPLYEGQLDMVTGSPFVQQLGYLVATGSLPSVIWGVAGQVYKDLPLDAEQRFFLPGSQVPLVAEATEGFAHVGWRLGDGTIVEDEELTLTVGDGDTEVRGIFSPLSWSVFREHFFSHGLDVAEEPPQHTDDAISGPEADPDGDGLNNFGEYAFAAVPWRADATAVRPEPVAVVHEGAVYPGIRYYRQAAESADLQFRVEASEDLTNWAAAEVVPVSSQVTARGARLVTVRAAHPASDRPVFLRVVAEGGGGSGQ